MGDSYAQIHRYTITHGFKPEDVLPVYDLSTSNKVLSANITGVIRLHQSPKDNQNEINNNVLLRVLRMLGARQI